MNDRPLSPLFEIDAAELGESLRTLRKLGGKTPGPGIWRFRSGEVEVEWKGGAHTLPASGDGTVAFRIAATYMDALAKTIPKTGSARVQLMDARRVRFDTFEVSYESVEGGATDLLTVAAGPREVLMLGYLHGRAEVENAGLTSDVDAAREKLRDSVRRAEKALAWVGIDEAHLLRWIDAHLSAVAAGKDSFEIAPDAPGVGQLDLFG